MAMMAMVLALDQRMTMMTLQVTMLMVLMAVALTMMLGMAMIKVVLLTVLVAMAIERMRLAEKSWRWRCLWCLSW